MSERGGFQLRWDVLVVIGVLLAAVVVWKVWTMGDGTNQQVIKIKPDDPERFVLVAVGDVNLSGRLVPKMNESGMGYAFEHLEEHLEGDALIGNLLAPVMEAPGEDPLRKKRPHRMKPRYLGALSDVGFTAVNLANPHTMDHGAPALLETLEHLGENDIAYFGGGVDAKAARRGLIFDAGHTRVAVLGAFPPSNSFRELGYYAGDDSAGVYAMDKEALPEDVQRLKKDADVVLLCMQWGQPYQRILDRQREMADLAAEAGVDVVHGFGARRAQGIQLVGETPVVFNVGNLVVGDPGNYDQGGNRIKVSTIARYIFADGKLDSIEMLPIRTNNKAVEFQPRVAGEKQARRQFEPLLGQMTWERRDDGWYVIEVP